MSSAEGARPRRILCTGIAVLDEVFRVENFPAPDMKAMASEFVTVGGGCAANAAVAIQRLGGKASFAGPVGGPAGQEPVGDRILAGLAHEGIDCSGCVRVAGARSSVSAIMVNARGERTIVTYRDKNVSAAKPENPDALVAATDAVLADNRFPDFVLPVCEAACARGIPVVIDADMATQMDHRLITVASHVIFSAESLRVTVASDDLPAGLARVSEHTAAFLAVTDGANGLLWRDGTVTRHLPSFRVDAIDTLAAGDVFHGAFTLALAEGQNLVDAMRFASAAAAVKCSRFGGSASAPKRAEVEAFLNKSA